MSAWKQEECLVCNAKVKPLLDFGKQPLANALLSNKNEAYETYDLGMNYCCTCGHGQLTHMVDPSVLFSEYLYASGTSNTLRHYFDWLAKQIANYVNAGARVLDIASNDGSFLASLNNVNVDCVGIDPATNLVAEANKQGRETMLGYFPADCPESELFDIIVAMNVIAHNPQPQRFMAGVKRHLRSNGRAVIQTSQVNMLERGEFDTIYHEHYSFFLPSSMAHLAKQFDLEIESQTVVDIHGDSIIYVLKHQGDESAPLKLDGQFVIDSEGQPLPAHLSQGFVNDAEKEYSAFAHEVDLRIAETTKLLNQYRGKGYSVVLLGVAAKAMTFINAAHLSFDEYADEAQLKIGKFVPGTDVPIIHFNDLHRQKKPTVFFVGAWNFASEIKKKILHIIEDQDIEVAFVKAFPAIGEVK